MTDKRMMDVWSSKCSLERFAYLVPDAATSSCGTRQVVKNDHLLHAICNLDPMAIHSISCVIK